MPIGMTIVMVLTIAGILAMFLVWRELDRVEQARRRNR
jgi:nitrate reductase NapAB chaperone NapD